MEQITGPKGQSVLLDRSVGKRGQKGPFFIVYESADRKERWGYFCGHCESADTAVDAMGRIECNDCRNRTKAEEWDAAHE